MMDVHMTPDLPAETVERCARKVFEKYRPRDSWTGPRNTQAKNDSLDVAALVLREAGAAEMAEAAIDVMASLAAAISLLERGSKKAAPSDKMFDQMIIDYRNSLERARAALSRYRSK